MIARPKITPEQLAEVQRLHAAGALTTTIAVRVGISYYRCVRLLKKLRKARNFSAKPWTPKEVAALIKLKKSNLTSEEIAKRLGRAEFNVREKWKQVRKAYIARGLTPPEVRLAGPGRPSDLRDTQKHKGAAT